MIDEAGVRTLIERCRHAIRRKDELTEQRLAYMNDRQLQDVLTRAEFAQEVLIRLHETGIVKLVEP